METWHVYQLRSDTELLYVGYTRQQLKRRLGEHRRLKLWWPEVTEIRSEQFGTEDEARQREKEVWAAERPKYNKYSPFVTAEERDADTRKRVRKWTRANLERKREWTRAYWAKPEVRERHRISNRQTPSYLARPTTVTGRRLGRRQQSGPTLFD